MLMLNNIQKHTHKFILKNKINSTSVLLSLVNYGVSFHYYMIFMNEYLGMGNYHFLNEYVSYGICYD